MLCPGRGLWRHSVFCQSCLSGHKVSSLPPACWHLYQRLITQTCQILSFNIFLFISWLPHRIATENKVTSSLMKISPVQFLKITFWVLWGRPIHFILGGVLWEKLTYALSIPPHHSPSLAIGTELPGPHWVPILYDFLWGSANGKPAYVQGNNPGSVVSSSFPALLQPDTVLFGLPVGLYSLGYTKPPAAGLPTPRGSTWSVSSPRVSPGHRPLQVLCEWHTPLL